MCRLRDRLQGLGRILWAVWCGELGFHLAARRGTPSILRAIWDQESLTRFCQSREKAGRDGTTPQSPCLGRWLAGRLRGFSSRFSRFDRGTNDQKSEMGNIERCFDCAKAGRAWHAAVRTGGGDRGGFAVVGEGTAIRARVFHSQGLWIVRGIAQRPGN